MPVPVYGMPYPKTSQGDIEQAFITDQLQHFATSDPSGYVEYQGRTVNATPTELFIKGKGNVLDTTGAIKAGSAKRLYVPNNSFGSFTFSFAAYNLTDTVAAGSVILAGTGGISVVRPDLGNVTLATAATGTAAVNVTKQANPYLNIFVGDTAVPILGVSVNTTNQCIQFQATGIASKTILWRVKVFPVFTISTRAFPTYGDLGGGDSLEP